MVDALIQKGIDYLNNNGITNTILSNPLASTAIVGGTGLVVGGVVGSVLTKAASKKRKSVRKSKASRKRSSKSKSKKSGRKLKFGSPAWRKKYLKPGRQNKPHTAGKRKDTSTRRIRYTKNNQPYIILASGKAKFISKKSASLSRRKKGGKY